GPDGSRHSNPISPSVGSRKGAPGHGARSDVVRSSRLSGSLNQRRIAAPLLLCVWLKRKTASAPHPASAASPIRASAILPRRERRRKRARNRLSIGGRLLPNEQAVLRQPVLKLDLARLGDHRAAVDSTRAGARLQRLRRFVWNDLAGARENDGGHRLEAGPLDHALLGGGVFVDEDLTVSDPFSLQHALCAAHIRAGRE